MNKPLLTALCGLALIFSAPLKAAEYDIDIKGQHAFIQFKVNHLGYSWLLGRFNKFEGWFSYDEKIPSASKAEVTIATASVDSNHPERDKHLRSPDFLNAEKFPTARFVSTSYRETGEGKGELKGELTLHGVTKPISIAVEYVGAGPDPWGGYRRGFAGTTKFALKDFGIDYDLGPASREVELYLSIEGIRRK